MANNLIDIVNFNADASCFSSEKWLNSLKGGDDSLFCQWLHLYVQYNKKISLGLIGATIADIKYYNPEAIELINNHQDIFEIILRPWAHDIGLYRQEKTFLFNVQTGIQIIEKEFTCYSKFFLPPEFMLTSRQIELLKKININAVFINPDRYHSDIKSRILKKPYKVKATSNHFMNCITVDGDATKKYLKANQLYDVSSWNKYILEYKNNVIFSWRDGESSFLLPDGLNREKYWLKNETSQVKRKLLNQINISYVKSHNIPVDFYKSYPIHSFLAWMQEMKMLWFLDEVKKIEDNFSLLSNFEKVLWLQLINSDILASVEKKSPKIKLITDNKINDYIIYRTERGFEGEDFLVMTKKGRIFNNELPHVKKLLAREKYLKSLFT